MAMAIPRRTPARLNTVTTYTLAHTAQCKLKLAANRPDRNLRFVLGHAFTLDNLMLRIVEIENSNAKSAFTEGKRSRSASGDERGHYDCTKPVEHFDCTAAAAPPPPLEPEHFDCTVAPPEPEQVSEHYDCTLAAPVSAQPDATSKPRRISFQDNNARPSKTSTSTMVPGSPQGRRSPPPVKKPLPSDDDSDEGTSSDDYDEPELAAYYCEAAPQVPEDKKMAKKARPVHDEYEDEEDAALELADDELDTDAEADAGGQVVGLEEDMDGLGLTRFQSASAKPPRMVEDLSDDEDEDEEGPESPPQLPADVDVRQIIGGEKDEELTDLYESVRRCMCHGQRDTVGGRPEGVWDVPEEKAGGRRLALVAVAA